MAVETTSVVSQLEWRYATKRFDSSKKIDDKTWRQLERSLMLSPSSYGLQPWKFVVVTDQKVKESLVPFSWNQTQPADCSHLVVLCRVEKIDTDYIDRYIETIAQTRGVTAESLSEYKKMMVNGVTKMDAEKQAEWMSAQCYIALGVLMTAASMLHVDNCPMEGFVRPEYDRILGLQEKNLKSVVVCALGYRAADDKYASAKKVRYAAEDLVIHI